MSTQDLRDGQTHRDPQDGAAVSDLTPSDASEFPLPKTAARSGLDHPPTNGVPTTKQYVSAGSNSTSGQRVCDTQKAPAAGDHTPPDASVSAPSMSSPRPGLDHQQQATELATPNHRPPAAGLSHPPTIPGSLTKVAASAGSNSTTSQTLAEHQNTSAGGGSTPGDNVPHDAQDSRVAGSFFRDTHSITDSQIWGGVVGLTLGAV